MPTDTQVVVSLSPRVLASLEHLARSIAPLYPGMDAAGVLAELADRVDDGVRRRGSWERNWLRSAFPLEAMEASEEPDPEAPWRSIVPEGQP
jgi:hypothetical protein